MSEHLDEAYLTYLYDLVEPSVKGRTFWSLLKKMYTTEFIWFIPNDDNRIEDGLELRYEFIQQMLVEADPEWLTLGCSVLEMMIGLSRRLSFETEKDPREWFWALVKNLDLHYFTDSYCRNKAHEERIPEVLDSVIWRTYDPDGRGGLFPLQSPDCDQREVEIWYQMNSYILEQD